LGDIVHDFDLRGRVKASYWMVFWPQVKGDISEVMKRYILAEVPLDEPIVLSVKDFTPAHEQKFREWLPEWLAPYTVSAAAKPTFDE
jgi:hypothetical protein